MKHVQKGFWRDTRGNFALMTAILFVPLAMAAGTAVDIAQIVARQSALQQAMDSAALAVAREGASISDARAREIARTFLDDNYNVDYTNLAVVRSGTRVEVKADSLTPLAFGGFLGFDTWPVLAASSADIAFNRYEIALVLDTTGSMAGGKLQAMKGAVLGMIDSMSDQVQDKEKLKFAVVPFANFVNVGSGYAPSIDKNGKVKNGSGADWLDTKGKTEVPQLELHKVNRFELFAHLKQPWKGCVETRVKGKKGVDHGLEDTPAVASDPASLFVPALSIDEPDNRDYGNSYIASDVDPLDKSVTGQVKKLLKYGVTNVLALPGQLLDPDRAWANVSTSYSGGKGPNRDCVTQPIRPLGNDYSAIKRMVNDLQANGTTNITEGVMWGWRALSPEEPFTQGAARDTPGIEKILIVLTDGANVFGNRNVSLGSSYGSNGYLVDGRLGVTSGSANTTNALMNERTVTACGNVKKDRITVYTIRLEEPDVKTGMMLKDCATDEGHFFDAPSRQHLDDVFKTIGERIVRLRLSS